MYRNILLAYDGSRDGREALAQGAQLASLCGAKISLLTVVDISGSILPVEGVTFLNESEIPQSSVTLEEGKRRLREWGVMGNVSLKYGNPAEQIALSARELGADLLIVGHRNQGALARWLNGSVGASILNQASCSVLVAVEPGMVRH